MNKFTLFGIIAIVVIVILINSCAVVKPGHRGVSVTLGKVSRYPIPEGLTMKMPFIQRIVNVPVKVQKAEFPNMYASSSSMQDVITTCILNYHVDPAKAPRYFVRFGKKPNEVVDKVIGSKLQEIVKSKTNLRTTEELLSKRADVRMDIYSQLTKVAIANDIVIDEFSMTNFSFAGEYQKAIEEKQVFEQKALAAVKKKEVAKQEGEAKIIAATAEAEANRLKQAAITDNLIRYEAVQKWDGKLPTVSSGAVPLINIK